MDQKGKPKELISLLDYLYNLQRLGIKIGLSHTIELLHRCGDPQKNFKSIHIAGTNGKGSTCSMVAEILIAAGYKVGVYSSPHLVKFNERIQVDGKLITDKEIILFIKKYRTDIDKIKSTFFETTTVMAFDHFYNKNIDIAVIETGLGGRLDSTNVISPVITAITSISLDHRGILGSDLESIAKEKGGIIKPGVPVVLGEQEVVVKSILSDISKTNKSKIIKQINPKNIKINNLSTSFILNNKQFIIPLIGKHQARNAALSISIINEFDPRIKAQTIQEGLRKTSWPGRLQKLNNSPDIFYDVAHNVNGINALINTLNTIYKCRPIGLFVLKADKEIEIVLKAIDGKFESLIVTGGKEYGLLEGEQLAEEFNRHRIINIKVENSFNKALDQLINYSRELNIPGVVFGSHYIAKEVFDKFRFLI